jgi:general secretion pathway protein N
MIAPRWLVWTLGVGLLALVLTVPLRVALGAADLERLNLSARQVAGTIWNGRIGDLTLGRQLLGTFDVRLDSGALLLGRTKLRFDRLDSLQGPLTGALHTGGTAGVEELTGRLAVGNLLAPVPVNSISFEDTTIVFQGGRCIRADGRLTATLAIRLGPLDLARGFTGNVTCDGERVRARLASPSGGELVEFYIGQNGRYRAWLTIRDAPGPIAAALAIYGFRPSAEGLTLSVSNAL